MKSGSQSPIDRRTLMQRIAALGAGAAAASRLGSASAAPGHRHDATVSAQEGNSVSFYFANFTDFDPHVVTDGFWFVGTSLLEGLVLANEDGNDVVPGQAESWTISEDGLTYTFTIRETAMWSNGDPVTANDFEWTYKRLLTPGTAAVGVTKGANSYQPTLGIVNAIEYLSGVETDWEKVGIKATDDRTLEISLINPTSEFLLLITHPSMLCLHPPTIDNHGTEWSLPENFVGNGAFIPTEWQVNASLRLAPNEHYWDRENVFLDDVMVRLTSGTLTTQAVSYESGEVDWTPLPSADLVRYQADPELSQQLDSIGGASVHYLALLRSKNPILLDVRIRRAISMAIDRETIANVTPGMRPGWQLVPDSVQEWDPALNAVYDPEQARALLAEAGYENGDGFPEIRILRGGAAGPGEEALVDILGKNLNIKASLDVVEAGVYVERRWQVQEEDYIGYYYGSYGSPPAWSAWVGNLWSPEFTEQFSLNAEDWQEYQSIQNDTSLAAGDKDAQLDKILATRATQEALAFGAKVDEAMQAADPAQQLQLYKDASVLRQDTGLFIPILFSDQYYAVKPNISGLHLHPGGRPFYLRGVKKEG